LPQHSWISHVADSEMACILVISDRDAMRRLGILKEEFDDA
jgi:hypothetical protein